MDVSRYKHKKSIYEMSINRGRMSTTQGAHESLVRIISFLFLSLLVKSFEEEIQASRDCVDTTRG